MVLGAAKLGVNPETLTQLLASRAGYRGSLQSQDPGPEVARFGRPRGCMSATQPVMGILGTKRRLMLAVSAGGLYLTHGSWH